MYVHVCGCSLVESKSVDACDACLQCLCAMLVCHVMLVCTVVVLFFPLFCDDLFLLLVRHRRVVGGVELFIFVDVRVGSIRIYWIVMYDIIYDGLEFAVCL